MTVVDNFFHLLSPFTVTRTQVAYHLPQYIYRPYKCGLLSPIGSLLTTRWIIGATPSVSPFPTLPANYRETNNQPLRLPAACRRPNNQPVCLPAIQRAASNYSLHLQATQCKTNNQPLCLLATQRGTNNEPLCLLATQPRTNSQPLPYVTSSNSSIDTVTASRRTVRCTLELQLQPRTANIHYHANTSSLEGRYHKTPHYCAISGIKYICSLTQTHTSSDSSPTTCSNTHLSC